MEKIDTRLQVRESFESLSNVGDKADEKRYIFLIPTGTVAIWALRGVELSHRSELTTYFCFLLFHLLFHAHIAHRNQCATLPPPFDF